MAYTAPTTRSTSDLITASIWNTDLVDNISYLKTQADTRSFGTLVQAGAISTGDGKAYIGPIPASLNAFNITAVVINVITKSTSGTPTVQVARGRQANATSDYTWADVLSTRVTIDANEYSSKDATAAAAIDTSNDDLATGDFLRFDIDTAGTGTADLYVTLTAAK